jgi:hypothetical protein
MQRSTAEEVRVTFEQPLYLVLLQLTPFVQHRTQQ